ncbi:MAG: hypothetical protein M1818_005166 [Claussenomyces sp. TS43310]|nr:MAG: hypothetical protein M1818_005166 [Claussenomyces sp. TS43310]
MLLQDGPKLPPVLVSQDWRLNILLIFMAVPILTYVFSSLKSLMAIRSRKSGVRPAIVPYWLPFLGNMFAFVWDPPAFASSLTKRFGFDIPLRVRIGPFKAYVISSASHFESILKGGKELNSNHGIVHWLVTLFGLPTETAKFYYKDNSGIGVNPTPGTDVQPENRHFHLRHSAASRLLYGSHLKGMTSRFVEKFGNQIAENTTVQHEWVDLPDLTDYLQKEIFRSATSALCGDYIFSLNPTFTSDFWEYIDGLGVFFKAVPRWLSPGPHRARDRTLAAIKKWHLHAWEKTDHGTLDLGDYDPYFGAKIVKTRYTYMQAMKEMTDEARSAEDLALLSAANTNAVPATIWLILEFLRDPSLLERVRAEVDSARIPSTDGQVHFDIAKLCEGVLLQSVLHETLRLRVAVGLIRIPEKKDYSLGKWLIPKGGMMFLSSALAARNGDLWNAGTASDPHPLDEFWSDRFIIYPDRPQSGPLKEGLRSARAIDDKDKEKIDNGKPRFSTEGLGGGLIAFGGGVRMCPGRFFAKNEMLASFAMLCSNFEIELKVQNGWRAEPDTRFYGVGAMPPKGKIPFRIRRRL